MLVNAAAITDRGTLVDTSPELFDAMFNVNVRAPFFLMQDAAKLMIRKKIQGAMVNILSMSSHGGQPFIIAYSGSKGALATLTKGAAFLAAAKQDSRERAEHRLDGYAGRGPDPAPRNSGNDGDPRGIR